MDQDMRIGSTALGRYKILDIVGIGTEGPLAKAMDTVTGQCVALKRLDVSPSSSNYHVMVARFQRCARLQVNHDAIVCPFAYQEDHGTHYLVMPFIEGLQLDLHVQRQGGRLAPENAVSITCTVLEGLVAVHDATIVHRDIKPANIVVDSNEKPYLVDFWICRVGSEATLTEGNGPLGSPRYMAPEQINHAVGADHRADLYGLAAVLYFMVTGAPPIDGANDVDLFAATLQQIPIPPRQLNPSVPYAVDQACMRALEKDPALRFQSAQEFISALSGVNGESSFCTSCGKSLSTHDHFCHGCGAPARRQRSPGVTCIGCGVAVDGATSCPGCRRPFRPANHRLEFFSGAMAGMVVRICEGNYLVGRDQLLSRDLRISRKQLHVACSNGAVQIQDADSANKTIVAGQHAVHPMLLVPGQEVMIAGNTARYFSN